MLIKDLEKGQALENIKFKHPETGKTVIWKSQWGYEEGGAGLWYRDPEEENSERVFPLFLDSLEEALEFEVVE